MPRSSCSPWGAADVGWVTGGSLGSGTRLPISSSVNNVPCVPFGTSGGSCGPGSACCAAGVGRCVGACARRPGIAISSNTLAKAPTPAPYAPSSPEPASNAWSGLYTPLAIAFWAIACAASVAPSTPPDTKARRTILRDFPTPPGRAASAMSIAVSKPPGRVPRAVAFLRCSAVAPSSSARVRASPAPDARPIPIPAATPGAPKKPNGTAGMMEPKPSPSLRPTDSS